tara:strand:+ start:1640 stop:1822 length:183 start_codon:yes stop_codon:yes gene_type:complete
MISAIVMGMSTHISLKPDSAPTSEYIAIPPASLSIFAVIKPGPIMLKRRRILGIKPDGFL